MGHFLYDPNHNTTDFKSCFPRSYNHLFDLPKVEFSLDWVNLLPTNHPKDSVQVHRLELSPQGCPYRQKMTLMNFAARRAHQERLPLDDELK